MQQVRSETCLIEVMQIATSHLLVTSWLYCLLIIQLFGVWKQTKPFMAKHLDRELMQILWLYGWSMPCSVKSIKLFSLLNLIAEASKFFLLPSVTQYWRGKIFSFVASNVVTWESKTAKSVVKWGHILVERSLNSLLIYLKISWFILAAK